MKHKITLFALLGATLGFSQDYNGTTWRPLKGKDGELVRIETNRNRYGWGLPYRLNNPHNYDTIGEYAANSQTIL